MSELPSKLSPADAMTIAGIRQMIEEFPRPAGEHVSTADVVEGIGVPQGFKALLGSVDEILCRYDGSVRAAVMADFLQVFGIRTAPSPQAD